MIDRINPADHPFATGIVAFLTTVVVLAVQAPATVGAVIAG